MLRSLPRALVARYAPPSLKMLLRRTWRRAQRLAGRGPAPRLLFAFGGRTEYAPGTGRALYEHEPAFRATIEECERISTQVLGGPSIIGNFTGQPGPDFFADETRLMMTSAVMQLALVDLWLAHGVAPEAVLGASLGEVAAVYAAGGLRLPDALRVVQFLYRVSELEPRDYAMLVVESDFATLGRLAAAAPVELFVVLVMNAGCCLAFCPQAAVEAARQYLAGHAIAATAPPVRPIWPYHSPYIAHHRAALRAPLHGLQPQPLARPCYLAAAGGLVPVGTVLGIEYWLNLLQYPVNIHGALGAALADGYRLFNPMGAHPFPFLWSTAQQAVLREVELLPALRPEEPEHTTFARARQQLADLGLQQAAPVARPTLSDAAFAAGFAPGALSIHADPYPMYAHLARQGGLHFLPAGQSWLVLSAELCNTVLRDPQVFSSASYLAFDQELIGADPPLHTTNRQLLQAFFSPKALADLRSFTAARLAALAAEMQARPSFDFVTEVAIPLTQAVSARLLGLSDQECRQLQSSLPGPVYQFGYIEELSDFLTQNLRQRPANPEPQMLDQLLLLIGQGRLTEAAAVSLAKTMWLASITTTSMLMSKAAHYLLTHPAVVAELRASPALLDAFIEEMLRLDPPLNEVWRVTTQPVVLGGQALPAGASVLCSLAAASRDPARYPNPDELDLHRRPTQHFAFGGGIHACMGAHLARLEGRIVVQWLLDQGPALRQVNNSALPSYFPQHHFRALAALPLTLQPVPAR